VAGSPPRRRKRSVFDAPDGRRSVRAEALRLVHAAAAGGDGREGFAGHGIVAPDLELQLGRRALSGRAGSRSAQAHVVEDAGGLPRGQLAELFGKMPAGRRRAEGLHGEDDGCRVMAVRGAWLGREARHDHVRPEGADHADDVGKDSLPVPDLQGLPIVLREPEVVRAAEVLSPPVDTPGREQFLGTGHAQLLAELRAEEILTAVPAGEREIGRPIPAPARQVGDDLRVFVIGMGRDIEHAAQRAEALQLLADGGTAGKVGGVTDRRGAGQDAGHEGTPPRHLAGAPALPCRGDRCLLHEAIRTGNSYFPALRGGTRPLRRAYTTRLP
jgi:hypothetical protein